MLQTLLHDVRCYVCNIHQILRYTVEFGDMVLDDAAIISFLVIKNADEAIRLGHFLNGFTQIHRRSLAFSGGVPSKYVGMTSQFFAENSLGDFMHLVH